MGEAGRISELALLLAEIRPRLARMEQLVADLQVSAQSTTGVPSPAAAPAPATHPESAPESQLAPASAVADPSDALCAALDSLASQLHERQVGIDPVDVAFLTRARGVLAGAGAARAERLVEILGFSDRLAASYPWVAYRPLHRALEGIRAQIAGLLPGWTLDQAAGASAEAQGPLLPIPAALVVATGVVRPDGVRTSAPALLRPAPAEAVSSAAWDLAEELGQILAQRFRKSLRDDLARLLPDLVQLTATPTTDRLRLVLNVHTRHSESADTAAAKRAVELLTSAGLRATTIPRGTAWDPDRFDLRRFERVDAPGVGPVGSAVGLRQIGLSDAAGLVVQKCLVLIAA